ncbi:MAG: type III pantothenate kinase [Saprospiraceae bacterium]
MTLDLVLWDETRQRSVYKGGNISPGVQMRLKAMHQFTARLPMVSVQADWQGWIGQSTQTALQNGGVLGAALEVEALTQRLENQWPDLHLILTGGDAALLAGHVMVKSSMFVNQNLVLIGLQQILAYNVKK